MALRVVAAVVTLALCACGGASPAGPDPSYVTERQPLTAAVAPLRIRNVGLGAFAIVADELVSVSATAAIEMQRADGSWTMLTDVDDGAGFQLRASCASAAVGGKPCITLRPGDVLSPVRLSRGKCQCSECNAPYEGGAHRLVVSTCGDRSLRVSGTAFVLPPSASLEPRWDATFEVDRGSAVRVDLATGDTASALLGLYRPRESTRRPLAAAGLSRLVELVRSAQGTDDGIVKRCPPGPSVAFELRASIVGVPAMAARETAVVLDFGCAALNVVDAAHRTLSVAYFDHRFADYVALAREALPDDREVARLH